MPQYMIEPEAQKVYKEIIPESWFNLGSELPPPRCLFDGKYAAASAASAAP